MQIFETRNSTSYTLEYLTTGLRCIIIDISQISKYTSCTYFEHGETIGHARLYYGYF